MSGDVVNLRLARKRMARAHAAREAAANRAASGRSRAAREAAAIHAETAARHLDGHRLESGEAVPNDPDTDGGT